MRWRDLRRVGEEEDGGGSLVVDLGLGLGVVFVEVEVVSGGWFGEDVILTAGLSRVWMSLWNWELVISLDVISGEVS